MKFNTFASSALFLGLLLQCCFTLSQTLIQKKDGLKVVTFVLPETTQTETLMYKRQDQSNQESSNAPSSTTTAGSSTRPTNSVSNSNPNSADPNNNNGNSATTKNPDQVINEPPFTLLSPSTFISGSNNIFNKLPVALVLVSLTYIVIF